MSKKISVRLNPETDPKLKEIASALGYTYGGQGSVGMLLDAIASGEIILIKRS